MFMANTYRRNGRYRPSSFLCDENDGRSDPGTMTRTGSARSTSMTCIPPGSGFRYGKKNRELPHVRLHRAFHILGKIMGSHHSPRCNGKLDVGGKYLLSVCDPVSTVSKVIQYFLYKWNQVIIFFLRFSSPGEINI